MKIVGKFHCWCVCRVILAGSRGWAWSACDWPEGEPEFEKLAMKFASTELTTKFKEMFELGHELRIGLWLGLLQVEGCLGVRTNLLACRVRGLVVEVQLWPRTSASGTSLKSGKGLKLSITGNL